MINPDLSSLLLDIAPAIVNILQGKANIESNADFKEAYYKSSRNFYSDDLTTQYILQTTYDFVISSGYCDCNNCDKTKEKYYAEFKEYLNIILPYVFNHVIETFDLDSDFSKDYQNILKSLLNEQTTLNAAQNALKCWLGVLNDAQLQNELTKLTYIYIDSIMTLT